MASLRVAAMWGLTGQAGTRPSLAVQFARTAGGPTATSREGWVVYLKPPREPAEVPSAGRAGGQAARRVWHERGGPVLIEGPIEITLEDGTVVRSDRPVVALCACRRSKRFPFCDTSHRRRPRRGSPEGNTQ